MALGRRRFLRGAGVAVALPALEAFLPAGRAAAAAAASESPRRMVCICAPLGLYGPDFFPRGNGRGYEASPYLRVVEQFRDEFTVVSGLSHPEVGNSHDSFSSFLTGAPHPENRRGFRNSISVDQLAAEHIGEATRFPSLVLSTGAGISWTRTGAPVPPQHRPSALFSKLFLGGRPDEVKAQRRRLAEGRSILDLVARRADRVGAGLGAADRDKIDEYLTSVRELERRMVLAEQWEEVPKPAVDAKPPRDVVDPSDVIGKTRLMFDMIHLAIQTDSTRLISIGLLGTSNVPPVRGVTQGHHDLSHHGRDPEKIAQLRLIETAEMELVRDLLGKLKGSPEGGGSLLDRTSVFLGSNLGNASNHSTKNLPVFLAGGGFRHGQHLAFDPQNPPPLSNLYLSMLHRLGVPAESFGSSTGTLTGLEMA